MAKKINPAKSTPQAARSLRVGTRAAEAPTPDKIQPKADDKDDDDDDDKDDDDDREEALAAHESLRAEAESSHGAASEAYAKAKGTDSASALMAAEAAGDKACDAHAKCKASSMALRGAEEPAPDSDRPGMAPPPTPAAQARALSSLAGPMASAQLELAHLAAFGRTALEQLGAKSVAAGEIQLSAAVGAMKEVVKLRSTAKSRGHYDRLAAAVHAGMDRAKAFELDAKGNPVKPLATWMKLDGDELDEVLTLQGFAAGASSPKRELVIASPDGGGEAGLAARAAASGMDIETRRLAEQNQRRSAAQEKAR